MIESAALTDVGRKRKENEDSYRLSPASQAFILADGMGGHVAGALAADLAVTTILNFVTLTVEAAAEITWPFGYELAVPYEHNVLRTAFELSNERILQAADEQGCWGMGATAVAAWIRNGCVFYGHVGDSRIYHFRNGSLEQLTRDHTLVAEQVRRGIIRSEDARKHPLRHVVTHAMGTRESFVTDIGSRPLQDDDLLLLCSDGLSDPLGQETLCGLLQSSDRLDVICCNLVKAANQAGGDDNVTVILLRYRSS